MIVSLLNPVISETIANVLKTEIKKRNSSWLRRYFALDLAKERADKMKCKLPNDGITEMNAMRCELQAQFPDIVIG